MRKPKRSGGAKQRPERNLPGGRAWARVEQDALSRGLGLETPPPTEPGPSDGKKHARRPARKKRG